MNCFVCGRAGKPEILQALGLSLSDLFAASFARAQPPKRQRRRRVETYRYEDINGHLLAEKVRYEEPKSFRWRSPRPGGGSDWKKAEGITLYRLPHLIDQRLVLVVEGEKAVNRVVSLGFAATCPPTGSNVWTEEYADALWRAGAMIVVVLNDNDLPGRKHTQRVARLCHGYQAAAFISSTQEDPWGSWPCATIKTTQPRRGSAQRSHGSVTR